MKKNIYLIFREKLFSIGYLKNLVIVITNFLMFPALKID